jgi:hypothetical protein
MLEIPRYSRVAGEISRGSTSYVAESRFSRHKWSPDDQIASSRNGGRFVAGSFVAKRIFGDRTSLPLSCVAGRDRIALPLLNLRRYETAQDFVVGGPRWATFDRLWLGRDCASRRLCARSGRKPDALATA